MIPIFLGFEVKYLVFESLYLDYFIESQTLNHLVHEIWRCPADVQTGSVWGTETPHVQAVLFIVYKQIEPLNWL